MANQPPPKDGSLVLRIGADDSQMDSVMQRCRERLDRFEKGYAAFAVSLAATTYNINTYVVSPLKGMLSGYSKLGFEMDKLTQTARLEVSQLTALGFAAEQSGASINDVAGALANLNGTMDRARRGDMGAYQDIFKGSGLMVSDLAGLDGEARLMKIADVIAKVENRADKAEIVRRMFGSDALLPMLEKGREGIRELVAEADKLGVPLSKEDVARSRELAQEMNRVRGAVTGLRDAFLSTMAGPITKFIERFREILVNVRGFVAANPKLVQTLGMVAAGIVAVVTAITVGVPVVSMMASSFGGLFGILKSVAFMLPALTTPFTALFGLLKMGSGLILATLVKPFTLFFGILRGSPGAIMNVLVKPLMALFGVIKGSAGLMMMAITSPFKTLFTVLKAAPGLILTALTKPFTTLFAVLKGGAGILSLFLSPWIAIPALIGGVAYALFRFQDTGKEVFAAVKGWAVTAWGALSDFFGDSVKLIMQGDIAAGFQLLWLKIQKIFIQGVGWVKEQFMSVVEVAKVYLGPVAEFISTIFSTAWDVVRSATATAINWISETWNTLWTNAKSIFKGIWESVTGYVFSMSDEIGADQGNIGDTIVTVWYGVKKKLLEIWYSLRTAWAETVAGIKVVWNNFMASAKKGFNRVKGWAKGMTEEEILRKNEAVQKKTDDKNLAIGRKLGEDTAAIDAEREIALEGLRSDTADALARAKAKRGQAAEGTDAELARINEEMEKLRQGINAEPPTPAETRAGEAAVGNGDNVPGFLREMSDVRQTATTNAFQALAGTGDTTADKQLEVQKAMRDLLKMLLDASATA